MSNHAEKPTPAQSIGGATALGSAEFSTWYTNPPAIVRRVRLMPTLVSDHPRFVNNGS